MSRRVLLAGVMGLGALVASCGGSRSAHPHMSQEGGNRMLQLAQERAETLRQCDAMRSQVAIREEYTLGGAVAVHWVQQGGGLMLESEPEQRMHRTLNLVGQNLAAQSGRPMLEWTFGVLDDPNTVNAASAPGGYVFVTRALLRNVENEAQLAGVLAHEIAHVVLKHALTRYDDVKVGQCTLAANFKFSQGLTRQVSRELMPEELEVVLKSLDSMGALDLDKDTSLLRVLTDQLVEQLVQQGFAHADEFAADELAVHLIASAGYDPREYVTFLGRLPEGRGFSHHPCNRERQQRLQALLDAKAPEDGFPELPLDTKALVKPPLPPELTVARSE
jgi:predicted Zn-dependent protease